ncbi:hypothetical protein [Streptomyces luteogriseus]|uniref:hypothetical protein n=1 Tax=Streptomyces luteogriseus TaxID=68233 RepID=UPI0037912131
MAAGFAVMRQVACSVALKRSQTPSKDSTGPTVASVQTTDFARVRASRRSSGAIRPDAAEQDIGTALAEALPLGGVGVIVVDATVTIEVDEATRKAAFAAEQLQQNHRRQEELLRRELELDELARRRAKAREEFLQEHILANPAAARLYTALEGSAENWPRLGGPPAGMDLEDLVRTVRQWQPGQQWVVVAQVIHDFVGKLTPEGCKELLVLLAGTVRAFGDEDAARALTAIAGEFQ